MSTKANDSFGDFPVVIPTFKPCFYFFFLLCVRQFLPTPFYVVHHSSLFIFSILCSFIRTFYSQIRDAVKSCSTELITQNKMLSIYGIKLHHLCMCSAWYLHTKVSTFSSLGETKNNFCLSQMLIYFRLQWVPQKHKLRGLLCQVAKYGGRIRSSTVG